MRDRQNPQPFMPVQRQRRRQGGAAPGGAAGDVKKVRADLRPRTDYPNLRGGRGWLKFAKYSDPFELVGVGTGHQGVSTNSQFRLVFDSGIVSADLEIVDVSESLPRRGFRVRSFSLDEVVEAILVRGELEAVAARTIAERGLADGFRARMDAEIARGKELLKTGSFDAVAARIAWCEINEAFHAALVEASGMRPLASAYAQVNLVPLASPRATIFNVAEPDLLRQQLTVAHEDHSRILNALGDRQSLRAAALVREHAYRSGENKRRNFPHIDMQTMIVETLGIALVRTTDLA